MIQSDAPPTAPGADSLTEDQHRLAYGQTFTVPGSVPVIFRGFTPQGWPLINLASDPPSFGRLVWQDARAAALVAAIRLRYADRTSATALDRTQPESP